MLRVIDGQGMIEVQSTMPAGQRVLLLLLSFFPLLAPYELVIRPDWHSYWNPFFLFVAVISAGALAVSALLAWAAAAGLNSRLRLDRAQATLTYSAGAPLVRWRAVQYPLDQVARLEIETDDWSDGPPSYSLVTLMADGRAFKLGFSWSREEAEGIAGRVSSFLASGNKPLGSELKGVQNGEEQR